MRLLIAIIAIFFGLNTTGQARDIFVDNLFGDDRNDGASARLTEFGGGPCRSITKALRVAEKGDHIIIAKNPEPYRESITLQAGRNSGIVGQPFIIEGNGAVLDGRQAIPEIAWEHFQHDVFRFRPNRMSFQLLYLKDTPAVRREVKEDERRLPELKPREWCLFDRHIYFNAGPSRIPINYDLTHTVLPVGITLYEINHVEIRDLTIQGFQIDGVNAHDSVFDTSVVGLTCRGNGRAGISVGGASRLRMEACLVGNNGTAQVRTEGRSITRVVNCTLLDNTGPAVKREGGEVFVEPVAKTVQLPNSPIR